MLFSIDHPNTYTFAHYDGGDYACRKFGVSLDFLDRVVARPNGYVALFTNVNDVWFVANEVVQAFGAPDETAQLYREGTTKASWVDALDFFFGLPNLQRTVLHSDILPSVDQR